MRQGTSMVERGADWPAEFRPNLTPYDIFALGSFGGTYWRPIHSAVTGKNYRNKHKKYAWSKRLSDDILTLPWNEYDKELNFYGVKVGTTLEDWEGAGWISKYHPYGWVQWYCDYYEGRRCPDDARQIQRWVRTAGPNSRFRRALINLVNQKRAKFDDFTVSPKMRQTLQHWAYALTASDI